MFRFFFKKNQKYACSHIYQVKYKRFYRKARKQCKIKLLKLWQWDYQQVERSLEQQLEQV
jgi:uncharacterized protein HemY